MLQEVLADGSSLADSIDVVEFGRDNKIRRGFFGPLKAASSRVKRLTMLLVAQMA